MKLVPDTPAERRAVKRANELRDQLAKAERARDQHVVRMASELGLPSRFIAEQVGISKATVNRIVRGATSNTQEDGR